MRRLRLAIIMAVALSFVVAAVLIGCEASTQTSASDESKAEAHESETSKDEAKIHSAISAAPTSIAKDARIVDYPQKVGQPLIKLREGANGWTCFPDWQATPGKDPMCFDTTVLEGVAVDELRSYGPRYLNVHAAGSGDPPQLACADLGEAS